MCEVLNHDEEIAQCVAIEGEYCHEKERKTPSPPHRDFSHEKCFKHIFLFFFCLGFSCLFIYLLLIFLFRFLKIKIK